MAYLIVLSCLLSPLVDATSVPQEKVITDRSTLNESARNPKWPDNSGGGQGPTTGSPVRGRRWELILGVAAVGALLVYGLFRWQARTSSRRHY